MWNATNRANTAFFVTKLKNPLSLYDIMSTVEPEGACSLLANSEITESVLSWGYFFSVVTSSEDTSSEDTSSEDTSSEDTSSWYNRFVKNLITAWQGGFTLNFYTPAYCR